MKYIKPILVVSGLALIGYALARYYKRQVDFLKDVQYSIKGINIMNISKELVTLNITQQVYNPSNVEASVSEIYLDVLINGINVGNVNEDKEFVILPNQTTDVSYSFSFNPSIIIKNIVNLVTLTLALKDVKIQANGYVKVKSGFVSTTIPFTYDNNLKSLLKK